MSHFYRSYQYLSDDGDDGGEVRDTRPIFRPHQHAGPVIPRSKLTKELLQQQGEENALALPPSISTRKNLDTEEFAKDPGAVTRRDENLHLSVHEHEKSKKNQPNVHQHLEPQASITGQEQLKREPDKWLAQRKQAREKILHGRPALERHRKTASRRGTRATTTEATASLGRALSQQENMDPLEQGQMRMASRPHTMHAAKVRPPMDHNGKKNEGEGGGDEDEDKQPLLHGMTNNVFRENLEKKNTQKETLQKRPNPRRVGFSLPLANRSHKKTLCNEDDDAAGDEDDDSHDDAESSGTSPFSKSPLDDSDTSITSPNERSDQDSSSQSSGKRSYEKDLKDILEDAADGDFHNDDKEEQDQSMKSPLREEWKDTHQSECQMAGDELDDVDVDNSDGTKGDEKEESEEDSFMPNNPEAEPNAKANLPNNAVGPFKADLQATRALILQGGLEKRKSRDSGKVQGTDSNAAAMTTKASCIAAAGTTHPETGFRAAENGAHTLFYPRANDNMLERQDSTRTLQTSHVDGRKRKHDIPTAVAPHGGQPNKKKSLFSSIAVENLSGTELAIEDAIDEFCDNLQSSVVVLRQKMKQATGMPSSSQEHTNKLIADASKTKDHAVAPEKNLRPPADHGSNRSFHASSTGCSGTSSGYPVAPQYYGGLPTYRPPSIPPCHHNASGSISAMPLPGTYGGVSTGCQPPPGTYYADPYGYGYFQPLPRAPSCPPLPEMYGWSQKEASTMTGYQHGAHSQAIRDTPHSRPMSRASNAPQK